MRKKIMLGAMIAVLGISLFGCSSTVDYVRENMSEWTKVYYYGAGETFYVTMSSGVRESTYLVNGKSEESVDFALLSIVLSENDGQVIRATVSVDGEESSQELEINGLNSAYMVDLEIELSGDEEIVVTYNGESVTLNNLSKDFAVDDERAIEIASIELEEEITALKSGVTLNAECYLRVLDKQANNFEEVFWCFTVVNTNGESSSVIISTSDGSVLAKTA